MYGEGNQETPWKDFSPLSCISRIFRPECSFVSGELQNLSIQVPDFSPLFPGARGNRNGFCRFVKSFTTNRKHGYHPLQHEPAFPDDKSRVDAGFSYGLALPPDSERPAILYGTDLYPCFCAVFFITKKPGASPRPMISEFCMISSKRSIGLASRFRP